MSDERDVVTHHSLLMTHHYCLVFTCLSIAARNSSGLILPKCLKTTLPSLSKRNVAGNWPSHPASTDLIAGSGSLTLSKTVVIVAFISFRNFGTSVFISET